MMQESQNGVHLPPLLPQRRLQYNLGANARTSLPTLSALCAKHIACANWPRHALPSKKKMHVRHFQHIKMHALDDDIKLSPVKRTHTQNKHNNLTTHENNLKQYAGCALAINHKMWRWTRGCGEVLG